MNLLLGFICGVVFTLLLYPLTASLSELIIDVIRMIQIKVEKISSKDRRIIEESSGAQFSTNAIGFSIDSEEYDDFDDE